MKTYNLSDFMKALTPRLNDDYIHRTYVDENDHLILLFKDGVKNVYHIEDWEKFQLESILKSLKKKDVTVEMPC